MVLVELPVIVLVLFPVTPYVKFPAVNCTRELPVPTVNENALGDFAVGIGFASKPATKTSALAKRLADKSPPAVMFIDPDEIILNDALGSNNCLIVYSPKTVCVTAPETVLLIKVVSVLKVLPMTSTEPPAPLPPCIRTVSYTHLRAHET